MMHRSEKLSGSGDQEYFNEKGPVNLRVDGAADLAEFYPYITPAILARQRDTE
jgi:hypothetical protein